MKWITIILIGTTLIQCISMHETESQRQHKLKIQKNINKARRGGYSLILSLNTEKPNSAGGVDQSIWLRNLSKKTIKYVYINSVPYNEVGDKQRCRIRRNSTFRGQWTGPIKPYAKDDGLYSDSWYNHSIVCAKVTWVKIHYMDGSKKIYRKKKDIDVIWLESGNCPPSPN